MIPGIEREAAGNMNSMPAMSLDYHKLVGTRHDRISRSRSDHAASAPEALVYDEALGAAAWRSRRYFGIHMHASNRCNRFSREMTGATPAR